MESGLWQDTTHTLDYRLQSLFATHHLPQLVFLFLIYGKDLTLDIVINYLKDFYSTNEQSSLDTLAEII